MEILCSYMNLATSSLLWGIHTAQIFPPEVVGAIGVAEISRVEDVHISLVDDLASLRGTLLAGLEKKSSQLSVWSKASGKKMRLGLSAAVDFMWMPRSLTFLDSTCSASELKESYFHACGGSRRTRSSQFEGSL
jgi:hypothetical protein